MVDYYRYIHEEINKKRGGLNFAECIIWSLNFGDIPAKNWDNSYELHLHAAASQKRSGAGELLLCVNTAHQFAHKPREEAGLSVIAIVSSLRCDRQRWDQKSRLAGHTVYPGKRFL